MLVDEGGWIDWRLAGGALTAGNAEMRLANGHTQKRRNVRDGIEEKSLQDRNPRGRICIGDRDLWSANNSMFK